MLDLKLKIIHVETANTNTFGIRDVSIYPGLPLSSFLIVASRLTICIPGFGEKIVSINTEILNILDSTKLGITTLGCEQELPDGFYKLKYCVQYYPELGDELEKSCIEKNFFRTHKIQEIFDEAFLKLELSQCNTVLKKQALVNLRTIETFIQATIASANDCSEKQALTLYTKAKRMLEKFTTSECGCN